MIIQCSMDEARAIIESRSIPEPTSGCWLWEGSFRGQLGYGQVSVGMSGARVQIGAHRLSFFSKSGQWPYVVRHICDNPPCVNPGHLLGGVQQDNMNDCALRGRAAKGSRHGNSRLTESDVKEIIQLKKIASTKTIAERFAIGEWTINAIMRGVRWSHVRGKNAHK